MDEKSKPQYDRSVLAEHQNRLRNRAKSQVMDEKSKSERSPSVTEVREKQNRLRERAKSLVMDEKSKTKSKSEQSQSAKSVVIDEKLKLKLKSGQSQSAIEVREQQNRRRERAKSQVWDCGSSLYDSFELQSFKRQLDSAIISSSRSLSMPHFSDRHSSPLPPPPPPPLLPPQTDSAKKPSKISRSLQKLLRSVFRSSSSKQSSRFQSPDGLFIVYDKTGALTTIPEAPEVDHGAVSPEMNLMAKRAASARFQASSIGISCA